jgi:NAD(P)-dependent dehydrogenase (short-subunit alcohol dehydrogenase family)
MARVFITGSADGLGRAAAQTLLDEGVGCHNSVHAPEMSDLQGGRRFLHPTGSPATA